jgi:alginate O-acetyltransferase complex protein AlgJ
MIESTHAAKPGVTRRALLAGLGAGGISLIPFSAAKATIVNVVAIGKDGWLFPVWDEVHHVDFQRIQSAVQVVNEAVDIFKRANIDIVIPVTPVKSRIYREFLPDDFKFSADADRRYAVIMDGLRRPGTLVPDLAAALSNARAAQPGELMYFKADTHWTAAGAESAATEVAKQIKARLHLPPSSQPGTRLGPYVTMEQGKNDLAALLPAAEASKYPVVSYRIHQAPGGEGQASLVEDDSADTVVVGNSYMQPKYGFAAMLSNQLGRPVSLVWRINVFGPYRTLLIYLNSAAFRRRPKLVVWQFNEFNMGQAADSKGVWGQNAMAPQAFLSEVRRILGA